MIFMRGNKKYGILRMLVYHEHWFSSAPDYYTATVNTHIRPGYSTAMFSHPLPHILFLLSTSSHIPMPVSSCLCPYTHFPTSPSVRLDLLSLVISICLRPYILFLMFAFPHLPSYIHFLMSTSSYLLPCVHFLRKHKLLPSVIFIMPTSSHLFLRIHFLMSASSHLLLHILFLMSSSSHVLP